MKRALLKILFVCMVAMAWIFIFGIMYGFAIYYSDITKESMPFNMWMICVSISWYLMVLTYYGAKHAVHEISNFVIATEIKKRKE